LKKDIRGKELAMKIRKRVSQNMCGYGLILFIGASIAQACFPRPSVSQEVYPSKNITWILPYKPGGGTDISARAISPFIEKQLKKMVPKARGGSIIIKNDAAGAGEKAITNLLNAAPDGYTIGAFAGAFLAESYLVKKDYDITRLTFLVRLDEMTSLVVTSKTGPKDWNEVVVSSKTRPVKWGVGPFGRGLHVTSIVANEVLDLPVRFIPSGGTAETVSGLIRGDIQIMTISDDSAKALLDAGEVRVLLAFDRKSIYPGAVSIQELGHPELINRTKAYRFLAGPPGLSPQRGNMIVEAFKRACVDEEFQAWSKKTGFVFNPLYGDDLNKLVRELTDFYKQKAPWIKKFIE
jgi:tripartite-type tricarboxylate transporter receptor subunit TctC